MNFITIYDHFLNLPVKWINKIGSIFYTNPIQLILERYLL